MKSIRKFAFTCALFSIFWASVPARADPALLEQKSALFSRIFAGSSSPQFFYHPLYCSSNIFSLYFAFREVGISREGDHVVVIFEKDRSTFRVGNVRLSKNITQAQPFTFHVIYVSEGRVFDFDYGQTAQVDDIENYLAQQFPAESDGHKQLMARIYSAENYIKSYGGPSGNPLILDPQGFSEKLVELKILAATLSPAP